MLTLCRQEISSRSKYRALQARQCQLEAGHSGAHDEHPFIHDLETGHPSVAKKIIRDATMTTGASWKSEEAGPNRILRWVVLLSDSELLELGIDMSKLKPQVVAKLRDKAAPYDACIDVAKRLTWLAYQMPDSPVPSDWTRAYLGAHFGPMEAATTECLVCRFPISFRLFAAATRGRAAIETGHSNPRSHIAANVGFA